MSLSNLAAEALFGVALPPSRYLIGLSQGEVEINVPGYERVSVPRSAWTVKENTASVTVTFGPYEDPIAFDATLLVSDGTEERLQVIGGPIRLAPGMYLEHEVTVTFEQRG